MKPASRLIARVAALLVALVASGLGQGMSAQAANSVSIAVRGGERVAHASAVTFDPIQVEQGRRYQTGTATLTIDDASGTNAGWVVAIHLAEPTGAQHVALVAVSAPRRLAGQEIAVQGGPVLPAITPVGMLDAPRVVLLAEPGHGKGRYEIRLTLIRELSTEDAPPLALAVTIVPRNASYPTAR
ncbi:MAG: hypothetical protein IT336_01970 [Thermomicrobiales bacterium]|nr:hypothetical protein [Thermomicrobiales bacterium]